MKLKKGDNVIVLAGKDKGKKGKILNIFAKDGTVTVERVNVAKRHMRPTQKFQGGIIEKPLPVKVSRVMLVCPRCGDPTRVGKKLIQDRMVRVCRRCEEIIDKV
jgi:large subunit ribosomal protein L24